MLFTRETGSPDSPAIVFLHGGGLSSQSWLPVIERLPEFHCLAPDLPEQGQSRDIPYSIERSAAETAEIIRQRVPSRKAHLVALSLGGPVVFTLLQTAPELVDHAIVSGSSGRFSPLLASLGKSTIWMYRFYKQETLIRETLRQHGIPEEYAGLVREDLIQGMSPSFMRHYMTGLGAWELPAEIHNPLLVVVGENEMKAARGIARGYLKRYPSACGALAPAAKHAWCLQLPDLFAEMVRGWVTSQSLPPGFKKFSARD
jgi:pimeloyl-ACP methyl ester carboxylesterase